MLPSNTVSMQVMSMIVVLGAAMIIAMLAMIVVGSQRGVISPA